MAGEGTRQWGTGGNFRPYYDRDNYLSKNPTLLSATKVLQRRLLGKVAG
jgi:hypothetical protein